MARIAGWQLELSIKPIYKGETDWRTMLDRMERLGYAAPTHISHNNCRPGPRAGAQGYKQSGGYSSGRQQLPAALRGLDCRTAKPLPPISERTARRATLDPGSGAGVT